MKGGIPLASLGDIGRSQRANAKKTDDGWVLGSTMACWGIWVGFALFGRFWWTGFESPTMGGRVPLGLEPSPKRFCPASASLAGGMNVVEAFPLELWRDGRGIIDPAW